MEKRLDFVAVDFETLQAAAHDGNLYHKLPIQIGMQRYIDGRPDGLPYRRFIKPPVDTPWQAISKVGITWEDCEGEDTYDALHSEIVEYIGDLPLWLSTTRQSTELSVMHVPITDWIIPSRNHVSSIPIYITLSTISISERNLMKSLVCRIGADA